MVDKYPVPEYGAARNRFVCCCCCCCCWKIAYRLAADGNTPGGTNGENADFIGNGGDGGGTVIDIESSRIVLSKETERNLA